MFTSEKIPCHLHSIKFKGNVDKPEIEASFYITPLEYDLAYEISDLVAKQLFRKQGSLHNPVQEFGLTVLNIGEIPALNIEMYPHNEDGADGAGRMIPNCNIGKVTVDKLFSDKPDWSLIFVATLPLDSNSLELCHKYYRKTVFLTMLPVQESLFETDDKKPIVLDDAEVESEKEILCEVCKETARYLGADQSAFCDDHVKGAVGVQVRRILYV